MTTHKALLQRAEAAVAVGEAKASSPEHRQLLVSFLLHCADLCTPLLPPEQSKRVAATLADEFEAQAVRRNSFAFFFRPR